MGKSRFGSPLSKPEAAATSSELLTLEALRTELMTLRDDMQCVAKDTIVNALRDQLSAFGDRVESMFRQEFGEGIFCSSEFVDEDGEVLESSPSRVRFEEHRADARASPRKRVSAEGAAAAWNLETASSKGSEACDGDAELFSWVQRRRSYVEPKCKVLAEVSQPRKSQFSEASSRQRSSLFGSENEQTGRSSLFSWAALDLGPVIESELDDLTVCEEHGKDDGYAPLMRSDSEDVQSGRPSASKLRMSQVASTPLSQWSKRQRKGARRSTATDIATTFQEEPYVLANELDMDSQKSALGRSIHGGRTSVIESIAWQSDDEESDVHCACLYFVVAELVQSTCFGYIWGALIFMNALCVGIQTDYMAKHYYQNEPRYFYYLDQCFCAAFIIEISLRMYVYGLGFFRMSGWRWNVFDCVVVGVQVAEELVQHASGVWTWTWTERSAWSVKQFSILRIMRFFRLIRLVRLVRILSIVSELRMMVVSIADSIRSLCWTMLLLFMLTYVFGVYLTQVVTDHRHRPQSQGSKDWRALEERYGSLSRSMFTLYQTISEGIHWHEVAEPLGQVSPWLIWTFALYMAFALFALMNVITGVFVDSALRTADDEKKKVLMTQMRQLFEDADEDGSGSISWEEFEDQLDNPQMQAFLKAIDLDPHEAKELFHLLDINECDEIGVEELVNGCIRLQGPAKAIELAVFMHEYRRVVRRWNSKLDAIEKSLVWISQTQEKRQGARTNARRSRGAQRQSWASQQSAYSAI